jgi:hypothetical protein
MQVIKLSAIDWLASMDRLSIGSFYLLNVLSRYDLDVTDIALMGKTSLGVSTHRKHKKELIDKGYLTIEQIGKAEYQYSIGESNGS